MPGTCAQDSEIQTYGDTIARRTESGRRELEVRASIKQDYNGFGELANMHYGWPGGSSYLESMPRDGLGRMASMSEVSTNIEKWTTSSIEKRTTPAGLPLRSSWTGIPSGQSHYVEVGYGATTLLPASQNIDGGSSIAFTYDNDELLTGAGLEGLFRGTGGLLDSTALSVSGQKVSSKQDYNGFGELANLHYSWLGSSYLESMTRDGLGRIATMSEAVSGDSARSYFYTYTTAGRLRAVRRLFGVDTLVIGQYGYDANGNRTASTDPSGLPNAVTAAMMRRTG